MFIVSGTLTFDPAHTAQMTELISDLVTKTLAEDGNITYGFWFHPTEEGSVRIHEEWASAEAMAEHMATPHLATFMEAVGGVGLTSIELTQHEIAESTKLM